MNTTVEWLSMYAATKHLRQRRTKSLFFFLWGSLPLEEFLFLPSEAKKLMLEKVKDENLMTKPMA